MVFPVRRRLMGWTIAYLCGVFAAHIIGYSVKWSVFICALSILLGDFPFSASEERIFTGMHGHVLRW